MSGIRRACSTRLQDLLEEEGRTEKKGNKRNEKRKKGLESRLRYWLSQIDLSS